MSNIESLRDTIVPKSDQLNADDLIAGPITVQIRGVRRSDTKDQPISVLIDGDRQPYKPCKSMRRVMIAAWGDDGRKWEGQKMTLYCDPEVAFGGVKVGGIRISHMTGIKGRMSIMLTTTRSKRKEFVVSELVEAAPKKKPAEKPAPMPPEVSAKGAALRGEAPVRTISGDPTEGDLSDINNAPLPTDKADQVIIGNLVNAFASKLQMTVPQIEEGLANWLEAAQVKPLSDWTNKDVDEARDMFKAMLHQAKAKEGL